MLHHVEINVTDIDASRKFWGWLLEELGYNLYQEWENGFSYKENHTYLVFVQVEERFRAAGYHRSRVGLNHLAFHAESRKHVDRMTEKLKGRQVPILYQDRHPFAGGKDYYAVFFEDPDRIKVELAAPE
ncbi:VOC family protein [Sediminibacillus halophilus]|uniref:Catechol 2,3-dioxygenase n=1 Tax=Sediminibacillus halophilus TaxID=482461 RepID=A0A1G9VEG8_9BACI|nr:VOC family protein [Sediminibacillus halophilus]SDM70471.1 Catechol 2,3-dioxygenase [Sediminibacillus halophilus]